MVIVAVTSFFIQTAPTNYQPEGWTPPQQPGGKPLVNKNWQNMLRTPFFYLIFLMLFTGAFSGLMIASNASVIGQQMFNLFAGTTAFYVSLYSLSNCAGRVVWGTVSDKLGRNHTLSVVLSLIIVSFLILVFLSSQVGLATGIVILGLCFGGVMAVFPPMVLENYGPVHQGVNCGIVFCGCSAAAFFAPKVAASMATANKGDFTKAFYVAIVVALVGFALNIVYIQLKKRVIVPAIS